MFSLGLKEAKDFADKAPSMLKKNMKREEAEKLKKDLEAVGCVITLKWFIISINISSIDSFFCFDFNCYLNQYSNIKGKKVDWKKGFCIFL